MNLVEKIKQKQFIVWYATGRKSVHNSACPELEQSEYLVKVKDVLKILEGKVVVEKEQLEELADLVKNRPSLHIGSANFTNIAKFNMYLDKIKKKVAELGLDTKKEKVENHG